MTDQTSTGRLRCFITVEHTEGATPDTPVIDGVPTLTIGDLEAVLTERDQLAEKLAIATRTVAGLADGQTDVDPGYEAHAAYIRDETNRIHELLADARRDIGRALDDHGTLYRANCGSDCCEPLGWNRFTTAKQLLEEALRDITAAIALTGGRP